MHTIENVESLWHVKSKETKENLKNEKFWVVPKLFRVYNKRHRDPIKQYIKEAKSFKVGKLTWQLCNHDYNPTLYAKESHKIWTMTLDL